MDIWAEAHFLGRLDSLITRIIASQRSEAKTLFDCCDEQVKPLVLFICPEFRLSQSLDPL